jgi:hypothetical protein
MTRIRSTLARRRVRTRLASLTAAIAALSAASCGPSVKPPEVELNPAPKQRYAITLTVLDPPGQISSVTGTAQFDIDNEQCVPLADSVAGVRKHTKFMHPITFHREGGGFVGYVYADQLLNNDYYGLGTCTWSLTGVQTLFHAGKLERATSLRTREIVGDKKVASLCPIQGAMKDICLTPLDKSLYGNPQYHFVAILESRRISP